jgi:hypothetical protein
MSEEVTQQWVHEARRQEENCSYTAVAFTIYLRRVRWHQGFCAIAPIVFGALATWRFLEGEPVVGAVCTLLATVIPPVCRAWRLDKRIDDYSVMAGEFTNLRDRFRQAALVTSKRSLAELDTEMRALMDRLEKARSHPLTPPDRCFRSARKKIKAGHYDHDYDQNRTTS